MIERELVICPGLVDGGPGTHPEVVCKFCGKAIRKTQEGDYLRPLACPKRAITTPDCLIDARFVKTKKIKKLNGKKIIEIEQREIRKEVTWSKKKP